LKDRDLDRWRDVQNVEHVLGKYIISDRPMTAEQWAAERATVVNEVIDDTAGQLPAPDAAHVLPTSASAHKKPNKINGSSS
jgi:hypothetical protein